MPSIRPQDRASLCHFSFADGRRCLTPISPGHPHFCFYHAQKEAQSVAAEKLGRDLDYFFSGDYLSACDLSAALARLFAAVARGHIKPRAARTLAYLAQTLAQTIHLSQHEYINAFGTDAWRQAVRDSVHQNADRATSQAPSSNPGTPISASASVAVRLFHLQLLNLSFQPSPLFTPVSYTHLTLPTIYSV